MSANGSRILGGYQLSRSTAFYLQASIVVFFLAGSAAPTPLWSVYAARWGFTPITTTVVFAVYAIAVLAALLTVGSISDYVGRRSVLFVAALVQASAMAVFLFADGVTSLLVARVLQGLSTGAAASAVGAGLLDIDRDRGTIASSVGPLMGVAAGAIAAGLMVQYLPAPTQLVFATLLVIFVAQAIGVLVMPETAQRKTGALAALRPRFLVPASIRRPLLVAAPVMVATWALAGFYASLGPTLLRNMLGTQSVALGGIALFVLAASGASAVWLLRKRSAMFLLRYGTCALLAGVGLTLLAIDRGSLVAFLAGTAIAGTGFGTGFQGGIRSVVPMASPTQRAGVLSTLYVISYLAFGLPAVLAGFLVVYGDGGVLVTAREYGVTIMVLAAFALIGTRVPHRARRSLLVG
jgi:MFS family permease